MECLQIDWENIDATYERDEFYESIQAPKWIDFTAPFQPVDDHEWFCGRAGCTHVKKTVYQTEDSILLESQKNTVLQIPKKVAPAPESTASGTGVKRGRGVVSSSYSSLTGIKEAFAKQKVLHLAKMHCVTESNGQAVKRSVHASENQNPNQTCKAQFGVSKIPILKASEGMAKKIKMTESKFVAGKQPTREVLAGVSMSTTCSAFTKQVNQSQTRAVLDVSKVLTGLRKDELRKKSTLNRTVVNEQDIKVLTDVCRTSEPESKKGEAARTPFSVYASRFAMMSSLAMPSKRPTTPARSLQSVQLGDQKSASCRPPRVVARKDHKAGTINAVNAQTCLTRNDRKEPGEGTLSCRNLQIVQAKHMIPMLDKGNLKDSAVLTYTACIQDQLTDASNDNGEEFASNQPMVQCSTIEGMTAIPHACYGEKQPSHDYKENEKEGKTTHYFAEENEDSMQITLEEHLENLYLTTPSNKRCGVKVEMRQLDPSSDIVIQCGNSVIDLEMVSSQHEDKVPACEMKALRHVESIAEHHVALSPHVSVGQSLNCSSQSISSCEMNQSLDSQIASHVIGYSASQSFADCMHTSGELLAPMSSSIEFSKKSKQVQPVKDWQRNRGLKRKSSELNFKVNCSSKDHVHENDKVAAIGAALNSFICQQTKQSSATTTIKASPSCGFIDSCKEQHKKIKTTKAQPFKPFRLRTEERGALRELGLGRKEQAVPNPQELVHRALRMPSFGHPFRPQRSTKKLTVPKEPSFHSSRLRKTCTGPPTLLGS